MAPLRLSQLLSDSAALLRARPAASFSLSLAVVTSLLSVCCVLGLFTTPWFMCELFAVQLGVALARPVPRTLSWIPAGAVMLGAVLLVSTVAWLTLLGVPEPNHGSPLPRSLGASALLRNAGFYAALASALSVLAILPWLYAPLLLIERKARFDHALLESARLVVSRGLFAHLRLSLASHALQVAPPALAALLALFVEPSQLPLWTLSSAPLLCVTVPLGQGMIVSAYARVREAAPPPSRDELATRVVSVTGRYAFVFSGFLSLPLLSFLVLGTSLVVPSRVGPGEMPEAPLLAELVVPSTGKKDYVLDDTALRVQASARTVRVTASDGGGAGKLPLSSQQAIERVRIARVRDAFAIEIVQGQKRSLTFIDRAGVRLDDDLRARLLDRVPVWGMLLVLFSLLATAVVTLRVLEGLARVRRLAVMPLERRPSRDVLELSVTRVLRSARRMLLVLLPLSLAALYVATRVVLSF